MLGARRGRGALGVPGWSPQVPGGARGEQGEGRPAEGAGEPGAEWSGGGLAPSPLPGRTRRWGGSGSELGTPLGARRPGGEFLELLEEAAEPRFLNRLGQVPPLPVC